jgi:hypothetical protein
MTGANITPPDRTDLIEEPSNDRLSPNPKVILTYFFILTFNKTKTTNQRSSPSKTQWQKLSQKGNISPKPGDESKATVFDTAQTLKRLSSTLRKTPPPTLGTDSIEQQSPPTQLLRKTTQELLRKKSSLEQAQQDRSTSSSRRISMAVNDEMNTLSKAVTPQPYDRTPSMQSRSLTRSNSFNPANKDPEKSSSGERSYYTSAIQSRRVSMALNRSPVRAEELEKLLTKVILSSLSRVAYEFFFFFLFLIIRFQFYV